VEDLGSEQAAAKQQLSPSDERIRAKDGVGSGFGLGQMK
jgi:hypothetical protein